MWMEDPTPLKRRSQAAQQRRRASAPEMAANLALKLASAASQRSAHAALVEFNMPKDRSARKAVKALVEKGRERVHQELRTSFDQEQPMPSASVGDIAQRFGFRSRGHFAAAYQEQYGQSPSQTLNRAA